MRPGQRKHSFGVVKRCIEPRRGAVAERAIGGETRGDVVGIRGGSEGLVVATVAASRRACERAARVALTASESDVGSGELELRHRVVIEGALEPRGGVVTLLAGLRHSSGDVIRVSGLLEISDMASGALRWRASVASGGVTLHALDAQVSTGERERRLVVIEVGAAPGSRVVAVHASLRNAGSRVVRAGGLLKVGEVTAHALRRSGGIVRRSVALCTGNRDVGSGQRELRH